MSVDLDILEDLARLSSSSHDFVLWAFPWGEPGTELADRTGPHVWQVAVLRAIDAGLCTPAEAIQIARASGHGIGKSALIAWIILWSISTFEDAHGVVTANTERQLVTKTWAELGKWYRLFLAKDFFHLTATAFYSADPERERTWRMDMVPWSIHKTEAFAGLHNEGKRSVIIFDEGSSIPDKIYEVSEGALARESAQRLWIVFGNPTQNTGRFKDCFTRLAHRWNARQIDSREVPGTDKRQIAKWEADYGEDSDFFRVRVKGQFPRASSTQLIPTDIIELARKRPPVCYHYEPLIYGVDVARFGDNESVLVRRRGFDARTLPTLRWHGLSVIELGDRLVNLINTDHPDVVFIDEGGVGGGVVDYIRHLGFSVIGVQFGAKPGMNPRGTAVANKRAEMAVHFLHWLTDGGAIEDSDELQAQAIAVQYSFDKNSAILLESKEDMRKRGEESPDWFDAHIITHAHPVSKVAFRGSIRTSALMEYDPLAFGTPEVRLLPPDLTFKSGAVH